jgi:hypothetical protein
MSEYASLSKSVNTPNLTGYLAKYLKIPRDKWVIRSKDVKEYWKDFPEFQLVFPDLFSNLEYDKAICRAVVEFNEQPPETGFSPVNFSWPNLLLKLSYSEVLRVIIHFHAANYFTSESGGTSVITHERVDKLQQIRDKLKQLEIDPHVNRIKTIINDNNAYGGARNHLGYNYYGF